MWLFIDFLNFHVEFWIRLRSSDYEVDVGNHFQTTNPLLMGRYSTYII